MELQDLLDNVGLKDDKDLTDPLDPQDQQALQWVDQVLQEELVLMDPQDQWVHLE